MEEVIGWRAIFVNNQLNIPPDRMASERTLWFLRKGSLVQPQSSDSLPPRKANPAGDKLCKIPCVIMTKYYIILCIFLNNIYIHICCTYCIDLLHFTVKMEKLCRFTLSVRANVLYTYIHENVTVYPFMSYQSYTSGNDNNAGDCKARAYALCECMKGRKRGRTSGTGEASHTPRPDHRQNNVTDVMETRWASKSHQRSGVPPLQQLRASLLIFVFLFVWLDVIY